MQRQVYDTQAELEDARLERLKKDQYLRELEERLHALQRISQAKAATLPINRVFSGPSHSWVAELHEGLNAAHDLLVQAGSRHQKPKLGGVAPHPVPDDRALVDLDKDAFCWHFKTLLSDPSRVRELERDVAVLRSRDSDPDSLTLSVNALSKVLRLKQKPVAIIVCGHEKSGALLVRTCVRSQSIRR